MDRALVVRAQQGDRHAFEALTVTSHPRLFRVAYGILRDPSTAEDAVQQAIVDIWRYLRRLRDPDRFEAWAYRIVVNACTDEVRRRRSAAGLASRIEPSARDEYAAVLDRDQLSRGFARLSVDHRAVIVMRYLLDLSVEDTAEALGVPPGTVASRLNRALQSLRGALEADARRGSPATMEGQGAR